MRSRSFGVVLAVLAAVGMTASAQEIMSDDFEWGSICAWSNDLWYPDVDSDLFGDEYISGIPSDCPVPFGMVDNNLDCDDNDEDNYPGNTELCDRQDNDCDGSANAVGEVNVDGDPVWLCEGDCDDGDPDNYPGNTEICDGQDNNCNLFVDQAEVPVSVLCASVPNAVEACVGFSGCVISSCTPANLYFDVNGLYSDGCECLATPPVDQVTSCNVALNLGTLSDVAGAQVTVSGNTPVAGRAIWYKFFASDDTDTSEDEFLVKGLFLTNPSTTYRMDVYRGGCPGVGDQIMSGEPLSFSSLPGSPSINDSSWWFVKVYHYEGLPQCQTYSLRFSNGLVG